MSVHQVHPRSTFQKQFRTRPSDSKKQNATFLSVRTAVLRRGLCRGSVQRHTLFREIPCIADRKRRSFCGSVQRHTISRGKTCIATAGYRKIEVDATTHPFLQDSLYRGRETAILPRFRAAIHHFLQDSLYREKEIVPAPKTNTLRLHGTPQKKSARIGNDRCRHFSSDGP